MNTGSEFENLELSKIISIFNKNDVKLTFDTFSQIKKSFNEIFPICVDKIQSIHHESGYFSKIYTLSCGQGKIVSTKKYFYYLDLKLLNNNEHFLNIQTIEKSLCNSRKKSIPVLDINSIFGIEYSADQKYLKSNQYILYPYNISEGDFNEKMSHLLDHRLNPVWQDYMFSYLSNDIPLSVMSFNFDLRKNVESIQYSIRKKNLKSLNDYKKFDNLIEFFENEYHLHNIEQDELYLQLPSNLTNRYKDNYISIEMMPYNKDMADVGFYFDFLEDFLSKMVEYELLLNKEKDFILTHETTKNKSNLLKLIWNDKNDYEVQWSNIEFNNLINGGA